MRTKPCCEEKVEEKYYPECSSPLPLLGQDNTNTKTTQIQRQHKYKNNTNTNPKSKKDLARIILSGAALIASREEKGVSESLLCHNT